MRPSAAMSVDPIVSVTDVVSNGDFATIVSRETTLKLGVNASLAATIAEPDRYTIDFPSRDQSGSLPPPAEI